MAYQGPAVNDLGWTKQNHRGVGSNSALEDSPNRDQSSDSWQAKSTNMQKQVIAFAKQAQDLATMIEKFIQDITTHIAELEHDTRQNRTNKEASRETERRLNELKEKYADEIYIMQQKLTEVEKENANLKKEVQISRGHRKDDEMKTQELKEKLDRREKQLQKLRDECNELKTRLSKIISQRINDGNPDVTDLSDENRATKLAERYSELYDNQWTDAFEEIQLHLAHLYDNETVEKKAISILLQALKEAMQFCEFEIKEQDIHIKEALLRGSKIKVELPESLVYQLKQTKKFLADKTVDVVCQNFLARKSTIENFPTYKIETFVTECVKISWLMVNHDPPIVFDVTAKPGDSFDSKKYKEYTKRGPKIDFLVWPPMQIEGHSLLMKGIAQGKPEFVEETEIYPMKETVASRLNFQTGTRKNDAGDRVNTVTETTKFRTDQRGRKQARTEAYKDKNDVQEYETGFPLTTGIRPVGHNKSEQDRNHDVHTTATKTRVAFPYSEIPQSNDFDWKRDNKDYSGGKKCTDSTGVEAFMHTENYDMSSSRRPRAVYTGVDQRYDGTGSTTQGYKTQYHNTLPSKAEYGYQSQKYIKVNDVAPQTLRIQGWGHEAAYKQIVTRPIYQTSDKTYGMSPTYPIYDTPNETEWARYLYYKKKNLSREYIKNNLGEPSFNRCENYECYQK